MAVLRAFFDESGNLQGPETHVVFGGLVGQIDETSTFTRKWVELLGSDFTHIHMTDAMRLAGPFKGCRDTTRDEVLVECAKLAQAKSAMLVSSSMDKRDFLVLTNEQRSRFKNPAYGGFETCVRILAREFRRHDIHLWCDESEEYAETCLKLYKRLKSMNKDFALRLPSLTFANDEKFPGLQAADMVAYSTFVMQRDGASAHPVVREIDSIFRKNHKGKEHLVYAKGGSLGSGTIEP
jgi:hypothetical protein